MKTMSPRAMLVMSMTVFGTIGLFVRNIPLASGEIALYRAVLAALLIGGYLLLRGQKIDLSAMRKQLPILVFSGIAIGINWILLFEAYRYTTVSVATLSYYFAPVIVTAVSPLLFREKLTVKQMICFVMSTAGLVMITVSGDMSKGGTDLLGILCGLGAACFYASVVLMNKFVKDVDGIQRTLIQFVSAIVVLVPYVLFTDGLNFATLQLKGWICLLVVGLFHTGVTYCLYFSALKDLPGQKAAILSYIDPLVAVLVSVVVLGESMGLLQVIGGLLILGFTLWNELSATKEL